MLFVGSIVISISANPPPSNEEEDTYFGCGYVLCRDSSHFAYCEYFNLSPLLIL
jgi:hypothetical protein